MENEKDIFEAEIDNIEKEFVDAEVVEDEVTDYRDYEDSEHRWGNIRKGVDVWEKRKK